MTLDQVPAAAQVLVDSNIFVYHFQPHPVFGPMCNRFMERVERQEFEAYTIAHLLGETAHRLMLIEATALPGWATGKTLNRLKQHASAISQLSLFQSAVDAVLQSRIVVLPVTGGLVAAAAGLSRHVFGNTAAC